MTDQIDQMRDISRINDQTATKIRESVGILCEKRIPIDTEKFEHITRHFIWQMEEVKKANELQKQLGR